MDKNKLKELALAASGTWDFAHQPAEAYEFTNAATPAAILELLAELETARINTLDSAAMHFEAKGGRMVNSSYVVEYLSGMKDTLDMSPLATTASTEPADQDSARLDWLESAMSSSHPSVPHYDELAGFGYPYLVNGSPMGGGVGFRGCGSLREAIDAAREVETPPVPRVGGNTKESTSPLATPAADVVGLTRYSPAIVHGGVASVMENPRGSFLNFADVAALLATKAAPEPAPLWQGMDSAPTDGTEILIRFPLQGNAKSLASFNTIHKYWSSKGDAIFPVEQKCEWTRLPSDAAPIASQAKEEQPDHASRNAALRAAPAGSVDAGGAVPAYDYRAKLAELVATYFTNNRGDNLYNLMEAERAHFTLNPAEAATPVPPAAPAEQQSAPRLAVFSAGFRAPTEAERQATPSLVAVNEHEGLKVWKFAREDGHAVQYVAKAEAQDAPADRGDSDTAAEMKRLHDALCFWLPQNRGEFPAPMRERIAADAYLLVGYDDMPDAKSAEELGWISTAQQSTQAERAAASDGTLKLEHTPRGFGIIKFTDRYGVPCSLQASSLASEAAIWFGCTDANPRVMVPGKSWQPVEMPEGYIADTRMHLTQDQVAALLPTLQHFAETGEVAAPVAQEVEQPHNPSQYGSPELQALIVERAVEQPHMAGAARQGGDTSESIIDAEGLPLLIRNVINTNGHASALKELYDFINAWDSRRVAVARRDAERALREAAMLLRPFVQDGVTIRVKDARATLAKLDAAIRSTAADSPTPTNNENQG
jgi:hypothetical protein